MESFLGRMARLWDAGEVFTYAILGPPGKTVLGNVGLYDNIGPSTGEIGYWVHVDHTGRGIATAAALTEVGMALPGTERVEIHCDQNNRASAAVAARLGYRLDRIENDEQNAPGESGNQMVWIMSRDAYPGSAAENRLRAVT